MRVAKERRLRRQARIGRQRARGYYPMRQPLPADWHRGAWTEYPELDSAQLTTRQMVAVERARERRAATMRAFVERVEAGEIPGVVIAHTQWVPC